MQDNPLVSIGLPVTLAVIMIGIGLTLTTADFARERRAPTAAVIGTIAQIVALPAIAFGIAWALRLPPEVAVGLIVAGACPGGSTSNLIAYLARVNVALSIVLTVLSSIAIIATLPLWTNLALDWQGLSAETAVRVPVSDTVGILVGVVLVPVAIGMAVRRRRPDLADRLERFVTILGGVVLALLVIGITLSVRDQVGALLASSGPATLLLCLAGIGIGLGLTTAARLTPADRLTVAIELGVKNTTLGLLITLTVIGSEAVSFTTAVYGLVMYLPAFGLVLASRRRPTPENRRRAAARDRVPGGDA